MTMQLTDLTDATILMVDDEPANIALLERILHEAGFTNVTSTTDPMQVESLVRSLSPDLLLLDLQMPHPDGFEVMSLLRGVPQATAMPIVVLTADVTTEARHSSLGMGASDFLTKPFDMIEVVLRVKNTLRTRFLQLQLEEHNEMLEVRVKERTQDLWQTVRQLEKAENDLLVSFEETVRRLSIAAEFRDNETQRHIMRMSQYCAFLSRKAGFDEESCRAIRTASQMHDIGKIGTPDSILLKPGPLTPEQRAIMRHHAEDGWQILKDSDSELLQLAATIALTHHERMDGSGYPKGLRGDEIPREGRVAAIADVFDALSTNRIYRKAYPLPEVWQMLRDGRGTLFDAELLDLFFASMDGVLTIMESDGEVEVC